MTNKRHKFKICKIGSDRARQYWQNHIRLPNTQFQFYERKSVGIKPDTKPDSPDTEYPVHPYTVHISFPDI